MCRVRVVTDLAECGELWQRNVPQDSVWDLWDLRICFHRQFRRPLHFLSAANGDGVCGLLPLCRIEEAGGYGYFPGETWQGKTWLEQNRVLGENSRVVEALLAACPAERHIRYLLPIAGLPADRHVVDETGYLFLPPRYDYDLENYFGEFSRRSAKRLKRDLANLARPGVEYRRGSGADFDFMVSMNVGGFGGRSYFHDPRFRESFRAVTALLEEKGWLRVTTVLIGGEPAAVDLGCVRDGVYTLLAGGTSPDFPGVAKLINIHHMRTACEERLECADFLCGDFKWKTLFHLTPRPLYLLT